MLTVMEISLYFFSCRHNRNSEKISPKWGKFPSRQLPLAQVPLLEEFNSVPVLVTTQIIGFTFFSSCGNGYKDKERR